MSLKPGMSWMQLKVMEDQSGTTQVQPDPTVPVMEAIKAKAQTARQRLNEIREKLKAAQIKAPNDSSFMTPKE